MFKSRLKIASDRSDRYYHSNFKPNYCNFHSHLIRLSFINIPIIFIITWIASITLSQCHQHHYDVDRYGLQHPASIWFQILESIQFCCILFILLFIGFRSWFVGIKSPFWTKRISWIWDAASHHSVIYNQFIKRKTTIKPNNIFEIQFDLQQCRIFATFPRHFLT